jgi:hypothetical protein
MAKLIRNIEVQQNSIGADGKALTEVQLQTKLLNYLTVSGGYISTERDELGNILLHEDPNLLGSQLKLVTQYISVDVERRDYNDGEIQKVFDTEIDELYKPPKTKTADELRAEIERMRRLLAEAEADINITVQEVVLGNGDDKLPGDGDGEEENGKDEETEKFTSFAGFRMAPYTIESTGIVGDINNVTILNDIIVNVQTAIWNTENQRIEHLNSPNEMVKYQIILNNETQELTAKVESMLANPEQFQGWYFDSENLGNTQNYVSIGNQNNIVTISLSGDREANKGPENRFTVAVAYKDEAPPPPTTDTLRFQMEEMVDTLQGSFSGLRDDVIGKFRWTLKDEAGNFVGESAGSVSNPFSINMTAGQELTMTMIQAESTPGVKFLDKWYTIADDNTAKDRPTTIKNTVTFTIPENIKGLILRYYPE